MEKPDPSPESEPLQLRPAPTNNIQPWLQLVADTRAARVEETGAAKLISIDMIRSDPNQPRKTFRQPTLKTLADSIRERGLLQPILVRPFQDGFSIVAGERRWRAAKTAGLKRVPALITHLTDAEAKVISLIENMQREDLNDLDKSRALKELKVNLGSPWEEIARLVGLTRRRVLHLVALAKMPEPIQAEITAGTLTEKHGRALRLLNQQPKIQEQVTRIIKERRLTGDQALALVHKVQETPSRDVESLAGHLTKGSQRGRGKEAPQPTKQRLSLLFQAADSLIAGLSEAGRARLNQEESETLVAKLLQLEESILQARRWLGLAQGPTPIE